MNIRRCLVFHASYALFAVSLFAASDAFPPGGRVLDAQFHHLGRERFAGWPEVPAKPEGLRMAVSFDSPANTNAWTMAIRQRDVTERSLLKLNGREIAQLQQNLEPGVFFYALPPGALQSGENRLTIVNASPRDNLVVGPIQLFNQPVSELKPLYPVTLTVTDFSTGKSVPARITITDPEGNLVELFGASSDRTAVRLGTLYTLGTETRFRLPQGEYIFYATRGMEWSRAEKKVEIQASQAETRIPLTIRREVDTTGFIAADTHVHTLTFSGHGDASVEERLITLAGEGVELAIATDHNHNTDYQPDQKKMALNDYFTAVVGNEVSTPVGHINAFPLQAADPVPPNQLTEWGQLVDGIRAKGAKVVILNHPRGHKSFNPFNNTYPLNRGSGEFAKKTAFPFDAMELVNSGGTSPDPVYLLQDWFALLNHGERVTAVAGADSHTVNDPVGWYRNYVPSTTDNPAEIDVNDACHRFLAGETSVAMGIFTDIRVDGCKMGQTLPPQKRPLAVRLRVAAPAWVTPRRVLLFVNGQQVAERRLPENDHQPTDMWLDFSVAPPGHDAYLVGAIIGDGITHPCAGFGKKNKNGRNTSYTFATTNPVYFDADGNGKYESPREQARALLNNAGQTLEQQWQAIKAADEVIAVQMASLLRAQTPENSRAPLDKLIREAAAQHPLFAEYAAGVRLIPSPAQGK